MTKVGEHINYKECLAAWFGIKSFGSKLTAPYINLLTANTTTVAYLNTTTTVAYLNNMGGMKQKCNELARKIWKWCYKNNNWITAPHLPGTFNVRADRESRSKHDNMEWEIDSDIFEDICQMWVKPEIDLCASHLNCKVRRYFYWKLDSCAQAVDAVMEITAIGFCMRSLPLI